MAEALTAALARELLSRRDFSDLKRALAAAPPSALARLWPRLKPLERAALWRLVAPARLAAAAKALPKAARWEAYQAQAVECLAPLLEDAPLARSLFRAPTRREAALLSRGLR
jgi:Mg/Co/Ni transporter MgtE